MYRLGDGDCFVKYLNERFGIIINGYTVEERKSKVYLFAPELATIDNKFVQRKGLLVGKLDSIYGIKPSLDFVLTFGHMAKKNFVRMDYERIFKLYSGERVDIESGQCEDGLVIVQDVNGNGAALVFKRGNLCEPLIPKERLIEKTKAL